MRKKKEGFLGQKSIVIPESVIHICKLNDVLSSLYITHIGYYPHAKNHFRKRSDGCHEHILIYCIDGNGSVEINEVEYEISPGSFVIIPKNLPHKYESHGQSPWTIYWMHFNGKVSDGLVQFYKGIITYPIKHLNFSQARINLFNNIFNTLIKGYEVSNLMFVNMLAWSFLASFIFNTRYEPPREFDASDVIERAIDFISNNLDKNISLNDLANLVNMSASYFSTYFKSKTGFTPIEYLNQRKIQKACQYLVYTELRIKEISHKIGIDDHHYFSRLFNKIMHTSATDYRRTYKY